MKIEINYYKSLMKKAFKTLTKKFSTSRTQDIDLIIENLIIKNLIKKTENFTLISEESGITTVGDPKLTFFLDPIDGTGNFIKGIPIYAVSLAVSRYKRNCIDFDNIRYAIIVSSLGLTFEAINNRGIYLNGVKIRKCRLTKDKKIQECFIRIDPHEGLRLPTSHMRLLGASSIELGFLVLGSFDAFIDCGTLKLTDLAAPYLFLKEAGISFSDIEGKSTFIFRQKDIKNKFSLVAANNKTLHEKILNILRGSR